MKKLLVIISILLALSVSTFAYAETDLTTMTDEEIYQLIKDARKELKNRNSDSKLVICDENGIVIYLTGKNDDGSMICLNEWKDATLIGCVIENNTDRAIEFGRIDHLTVNGFVIPALATFGMFDGTLNPNNKAMGGIAVIHEYTDISCFEDITSIQFNFIGQSNNENIIEISNISIDF